MSTIPLYDALVGQVVRIYSPQSTFVGVLESTTHDMTFLRPSLVPLGSPLEERTEIYSDKPKMIQTHAILTMEPIPDGFAYMEKIRLELKELNRRKQFMAQRELAEKGYYRQEIRQLELFNRDLSKP
jgi:hypothetical protein